MTDSLFPDLIQDKPSAPVPKPQTRQAQLGQFLTRESVANFMAKLFPVTEEDIRLLDAGAGKADLTAAFVRNRRAHGLSCRIEAHAYEIDDVVINDLRRAATNLRDSAAVDMTVIEGDFIERGASMLRMERGMRYTHAILNPPYKKINSGSLHRALLRSIGLETVNLYSGFVGVSLALMEQGGELVAIIPRSFCNGPYYEPFRRFVMKHAAIRHIHLFDSRNKAFSDDGVLQENVIIRMTRGAKQGTVIVSTSADDSFTDYSQVEHPFDKIVLPGDDGQFFHIPTGDDTDLLDTAAFRFRLEDIGIGVSTGPVVDFRLRDEICADPEPGTVPLLYPGHFSSDGLEWPKPGFKKPNAIRRNRATEKWLFPIGFYTVVRRFSSKEERRRIVANVLNPADLPAAAAIGFENHLNVIHQKKQPLDPQLAHGVAVYLNSTIVDQYFRRFNGHTQVNATDLKTLPFPSRASLIELGKWSLVHHRPTQDAINHQVECLA